MVDEPCEYWRHAHGHVLPEGQPVHGLVARRLVALDRVDDDASVRGGEHAVQEAHATVKGQVAHLEKEVGSLKIVLR